MEEGGEEKTKEKKLRGKCADPRRNMSVGKREEKGRKNGREKLKAEG